MLNSLLAVMALSASTPTIETHEQCTRISSIAGSMAKLRDMNIPRSEALTFMYKADVPEDIRKVGIQLTNAVYDAPELSVKVVTDVAYTSCVKP